MQIETDRLILRPIQLGDEEDIYDYAKSQDVGIHAGWAPHGSIEETLEIMQEVFIDQENVFGIVLKESGKMVGSIGLIPDPKRQNEWSRMLGYAIGDAYWGRGYMTEAAQALLRYGFDALQLDLISAYCYPHNERSQRVLTKCGFELEGWLRMAEIRYDGMLLDHLCYALLRPNPGSNQ